MEIRILHSKDIQKCPHVIMVPEHYREDGSCRCNDPDHKEMAGWGYAWIDGRWRDPEEAEGYHRG